MANRTIQMLGQAYAESGDVSVVMTVGGVEVFNGAVSDSTTVRSGQPSTENVLWTWTLDENTTGNQSVSIAVSGGELCLGPVKYNGVPKLDQTRLAWVNDTLFPTKGSVPADHQATMAGYCTEAELGSDLYNAMMAGTLTNATAEQDAAIEAAFEAANTAPDWDNYYHADDIRSSAQINGEAVSWSDDDAKKQNWVILQNGDTFTYTWEFSPATIYAA